MCDDKIILNGEQSEVVINEETTFTPQDKAELEKLSKAFLSGASAPTTETETTVLGAVYVTASGNVYHCTSIYGNVFTWEKFVKTTDYPTSRSAGVIKTSTVIGTTGDGAGVLKSTVIQYSDFNDNITPDDAFVSKGTLNNVIIGAKLKPVIQSLSSDSANFTLSMVELDNYDLRLTPVETLQITLQFPDGVYAEDYAMSFNFNSGTTPTDIIYANTGTEIQISTIINWVGTDCELQNGVSTFTPQANKHYEVMIWFNGTNFTGSVIGYEQANANPTSDTSGLEPDEPKPNPSDLEFE